MIDNLIAKNLTAKLIKGQAFRDRIVEEDARRRLHNLALETNDPKLELEIYFTLRGFSKDDVGGSISFTSEE